MKVPYYLLQKNHFSANKSSTEYKSPEDVYNEIGYSYENLMMQDPSYENTCATRMSLALIKSGVPFHGRLRIKSGAYKGRFIEPGSKLLADQLSSPIAFGKPEIYKPQVILDKGTSNNR